MPVVAIGIAQQKLGAVPAAGAIDETLRDAVDSANVLPIHAGGFQTEGGCPREDVSGCRFRVMRIFRVEIVLANVDHRKLEELGEIHHFIQQALAERAFSEETY